MHFCATRRSLFRASFRTRARMPDADTGGRSRSRFLASLPTVRRRRVDFENIQFCRNVVILRLPISNIAKRQVGSGQELEEKISHELGLEFEHVLVELSIGVPVPVNVEVEISQGSRTRALRIAQQTEEYVGRVIEILMGKYPVINGHRLVTLFHFSIIQFAHHRRFFVWRPSGGSAEFRADRPECAGRAGNPEAAPGSHATRTTLSDPASWQSRRPTRSVGLAPGAGTAPSSGGTAPARARPWAWRGRVRGTP